MQVEERLAWLLGDLEDLTCASPTSLQCFHFLVK